MRYTTKGQAIRQLRGLVKSLGLAAAIIGIYHLKKNNRGVADIVAYLRTHIKQIVLAGAGALQVAAAKI